MGGRGIGGTGDDVVVTTLLLSSSAVVAVVTTAIAASVDVQSCSSNLEHVVSGVGLVRGEGADTVVDTEVDTAMLSGQKQRLHLILATWHSLAVAE